MSHESLHNRSAPGGGPCATAEARLPCDVLRLLPTGDLSSAADEDRRLRIVERIADDLARDLDELVVFDAMVERLGPWLERCEYEPGEALTVHGEIQAGLQLVVAGRAAVLDADGARLYRCGPGDVLEPWAPFCARPAAATVVARSPCRSMALDACARSRLETHDRALSLALLAFLIARHPFSKLPAAAPRWSPAPGSEPA